MTSSTVARSGTEGRRLIFLFGLVYFAQGICQTGGLMAQPLNFYFKEALGLNPAQTTEYLAVLTIPWTTKPLYGLVSDFIPLAGYRRKSWLLFANLMAALGFLWLSGLTEPTAVVTALMLTAVGTAASDVIIDALMVENGQRTGLTAVFQSIQWLWISFASIVSALVGGYLAQTVAPGTALHVAALITMLAPLAVMVASLLTVGEVRRPVDIPGMKATARGLVAALRSRELLAVLGFLAFWNFSPSLGTPWYYHQTDTLKFTQSFIGILGAATNVGGAVGAFLYWRMFSLWPLRRQLVAGIWTGTVGTLLYLLLVRPSHYSQAIALAIELVVGGAAMVALLATLTLSARSCPARAEGFTFAALMSVTNGVAQIAAIIGARLYTDVLHKAMTPLILISAAFTFACLLLLPLLGKAEDEVAVR